MTEILKRVPPSSLEAEQSILGAMLLSENCILQALSRLKEDDFYEQVHRRVWRAMQELNGIGRAIDLVTVVERMEQGGNSLSLEELSYLSNISEIVPSTQNISDYIDIVKEKHLLRSLIEICGEVSGLAYNAEDAAANIINRAGDMIYRLADNQGAKTLAHVRGSLMDAYKAINIARKSNEGLIGQSTGFPMMDKMLSGLQPSQLIVIAGRPGMGKTSFALNIVEKIGKKDKRPVAFFSLEMSSDQLASRLLCAEAGIDSQRARTGALSDSDFFKLADAMLPLSESEIYIDDTATIGTTEIMAKARRLQHQAGDLAAIVIDYLQLMTTSGKHTENRQQEVASLTRSLKIMARELQVPILLLSQLSRANEKRENKRPLLSDLRESGAIEQDADVVIFLHREDYYGGDEGMGKSHIIIAKQRSGPTGTIEVKWKGEQTRYQELDFVHDTEG